MAAAIEAAEEERRHKYLELAEAKSGTDPFLDMALALIRRGIPVFPLAPKTKRPLLTGWREITTTDPLILMWWVRGQQYNIGVPTGRASGWVVVDLDGETGRASWAAWQAEHGEAPSTLTSITGRADLGDHRIFDIPLDEVGDQWLSGGNGLLGDKLDVKADGAFVVVPPSVHPKTGKQYQWVDFDATPAPLPQPILDLLVQRGRRKHHAPPRPLKAARSLDPKVEALERHSSTPWGKAGLARLCEDLASAEEGTRDNAATYAFFRVGRLVASRQIDWVEAIEQLEEALRINGLGAEGVKWHCFRDGYRTGLAEPVGPPPPSGPVDSIVDEELLSQLSERALSFLSTNWDRPERRRVFHPHTPTVSPPVNGYNPDGPFAKVVKDRWKQCNRKPHIIAHHPVQGAYDLKVPCSVRACKTCAARRLLDIAAYLQDQINLRPGGTFYRADVDSRRWASVRRALAPDRLDVDFVKIPTDTGFTVLAYAIGDMPSDFKIVDGWSAFLDALAGVWVSMPAGRQNSAQIQYSRRWRAVQKVGSDGSKRIGITYQQDEIHALVEEHGGAPITEGRRTTWRLPEGVSSEQIIAEHNTSRRSSRSRRDSL